MKPKHNKQPVLDTEGLFLWFLPAILYFHIFLNKHPSATWATPAGLQGKSGWKPGAPIAQI
jgi:hypothetical protein